MSEPYSGTAYAAGEHIEVLIFLNGPVRALADPLTVPLHFGDGAQHHREARLVTIRGDYVDSLFRDDPESRQYLLYFAYTVQPGDVDTDGVVLGANPLGTESDRRIEYALDTRVRDGPVPSRPRIPAPASEWTGRRPLGVMRCAAPT